MLDQHDTPAVNPALFRDLFQAIDAGFCVIEVEFNGMQAVDYTFLEVNAAFETMTGLTGVVGRSMRDLASNHEPFWFDIYGRVAATGEHARFENAAVAFGRWYEVHAYRVGDPGAHRVAILFNDISERKQGETALRDSEERLQQALSAGRGIGTWTWDVKADRVRSDARFALLYGVEPQEAVRGAPVATFFRGIHPADLPRVQIAIEAATRTGGFFSEEYRLLQRDGTSVWVAAQGRCKLAEDGTPAWFPGVSFDISDRKRVEFRQAALIELADRLRAISDPAELTFAACEILGRRLEVSRVGYGIVDKVSETFTVERDWNADGVASLAGVLHFRDYGSYIEDLKRGECVVIADAATDARTATDAAALEAISARAFVNMPLVEDGRFVALLYATNIRPRIWMDEDLALLRDAAERWCGPRPSACAPRSRWRQSEEQFRVFAQAVPNQIWASHANGHLYWFNNQVYSYCGQQAGDLDGTIACSRLIHPDDRQHTDLAWQHCLADGSIYETEFRVRRWDGAYRWFLVRAEPVRGPDGTIVRWVGTNTDIDDRKGQASQLAKLNETLEELVAERTQKLMEAEEALRQSQKMEAVGQLTGGLAHDFNNLLTGITGSLELLQTRVAQGRLKDVDRYVNAAQGAAKRAAALTHRLLAFSRRQTLDPKPTDVNKLITGLEELVRRTIGPGIAAETVAYAGLWNTLVDPSQLENALLNLCINARDAMPDGGKLTIETCNRWMDERSARERDLEPGQYVSLCVSDTGTGMPKDVVERAFDPFFTTKPIGQGTGLGLSMIYGFVRQSGGQVRIYSEVGQGTMICLYLPRHCGEAGDSEAAPELSNAPRAGHDETVLVIDDEPTVRMLVTEVLEDLGYTAIEAADGASGLKVLNTNARVDLLVTDVGLPGGMNGRQVADAAPRRAVGAQGAVHHRFRRERGAQSRPSRSRHARAHQALYDGSPGEPHQGPDQRDVAAPGRTRSPCLRDDRRGHGAGFWWTWWMALIRASISGVIVTSSEPRHSSSWGQARRADDVRGHERA